MVGVINMGCEDKCMILKGGDGQTVVMSADKILIIDEYGNSTEYFDGQVNYKQNAPTYDELYEHWLKTKDKPKKKRKLEQLPGQIDLFNIIDVEVK